MRRGLRRGVRWVGIAVLAAVIAVLVVVSLPGTQRALWRSAVKRLEAASGWRLSAAAVRLNLLRGRFTAEDLALGAAGETPVLQIRRLEARWRWRRLVRAPHRLDVVKVRGGSWNAGAPMPAMARTGGSEQVPLGFEIGRFEVRSPGGTAPLDAVTLELSGLAVEGSLLRGVLEARVRAEAAAVRGPRRMVLGRLGLEARFTGDRLEVDQLELKGGAVAVSVTGTVRPPWTTPGGKFAVRAILPPGRLLGFWDPALAGRIGLRGRLDLEGRIGLEQGRPSGHLEGKGLGLSVGVVGVDRLALGTEAGRFTVEAEGAGWGRVKASGAAGKPMDVAVHLEHARLPESIARLARLPVRLPRDLRLSGVVEATVDPARGLKGTRGRADLTAVWREGRADLKVAGDLYDVRLGELSLRLPGSRVRLTGGIGDRLNLAVNGELDDPAALLEELAGWGVEVPAFPVPGGRLRVRGTLKGPRARPAGRLTATWDTPSWEGMELERIQLRAVGTLQRVDLDLEATAAGSTAVHLAGRLAPGARRGHATVQGATAQVGALLKALGRPVPLQGAVDMTAQASLEGGSWSVSGDVRLEHGGVGPVALRRASVEFGAAPGRIEVRSVRAELRAGRVSGSCVLTGEPPDLRVEGRLVARGIRPDALLPEIQAPLHGAAGLDLRLRGPLGKVEGRGALTWRPDQAPALLGSTDLLVTLEGGRVKLKSRRLETAAGPLVLAATVPLGAVPRPAWLWPDAPSGAASAGVSGCGLELAPVLELLGLNPGRLAGSADLEADLEVDPRAPSRASALVSLSELRLITPVGLVASRERVTLRLDGGRVELEPVELEGAGSSATLRGAVDLGEKTVDAAVKVTVPPSLIRLALPMVQVEGPLHLSATARGPLGSPTGTLTVDHRGGRLVLADPPIQISGFNLEASVDDGIMSVDGGSARVNGGHVEFGGGWDPTSGQGVVAELADVRAFVPPGILTRWNGVVALEPGRGSRLRLAGDLELVGGLWDSPFDLLAVAGSSGATPVAAGDPLERVDLEMEVTGRSGILVENNLGRFQAVWRRLEVGGTLARPVISGRVELLPGGTLRVGARALSIVRGDVELPPVPGAEPELEILTRDPSSRGGGLRSVGLGDLAQAGAAAGVGRIFGLEATAIEPVRVAAETETDPAARFTLGRRLGPHLSYFFSTNLAGTQDQTQVVQVGDWGSLPGLYGQWISSTTGGDGWALLERLRWGGTPRDEATGGAKLTKVRFDGRWPVAKWRLRRLLGFSRGQRWEPFLAFAARVRLERALASFGFPEARVETGTSGGSEEVVLHLRCTPGERLPVRWAGDRVPGAVRRRILALYTPGVPRKVNEKAMASALVREMAALGYPDARANVKQSGDEGLRITVDRGPKVRLEGIVVKGVPPETAAQAARWWSSAADQAALLRGDEITRKRFLRILAAEGFPKARVTKVRSVERAGKAAVVAVTVEPGPRRHIAEVRLDGEDPLGAVRARGFPLRAGIPYRKSVLDAARRRLAVTYREAGYPEVKVRITGETGDVIVVKLDPGPKRVISEVRFSGLRDLKEAVLRRGVAIRKGEPLRESEVDRTLAALASFPPVETVTVKTAPGPGNRAVAEVAVRERPRWTAGVGARWSSDRGNQLLLELDDEDLMGRGVSAHFRTRWGSKDRSAQLLLGVPPPPGGSLHFAVSGTFTHTERGDLTERDGIITLETWIERGVRDQFRLFLRQRRAHVYETVPDPFFPFDVTVTSAAVGGEVIFDRRDDPLDPRSGWFFSLNTSYDATFLGSDLPAVRSLASLSWALPVRRGWTLAQGIRVGAAHALHGDLDTTQRFYAGGETSLRGFDRDWVGPVDCFLGRCHPAGGGALLVLNQELRVPMARNLRGVAFVDAGQVWNSWSDADGNLSVGTGVGIRYRTPLGPLRLDFAVPVAHRGRNSGLHIYLGIGQVF